MRTLAPRLALLAAFGVVLWGVPAQAADDPLEQARQLVELGKMLVETGTDRGEVERVRKGVAKLREAKTHLQAALKKPGLGESESKRIEAWLVDVESRIDWYAEEAKAAASEEGSGRARTTGEVKIPPMNEGEAIGPWCRRVIKAYKETEDPAGQAALARGLASKGGVVALPALFRLFEREQTRAARDGVHEALAMIGTYRVSQKMASYAKKSREKHWENALDVIYLCLEKAERYEPEAPFMRAIREFHKLKVRKLSLRILEHLNSMDPEGTAALGEIVYVDDFGYQNYTIGLLGNKKDRRAVPPLVHLMNRFKFEIGSKMPAHQALLRIGWYAVPELVARLDDKAAGIWISWTLRKITGQTMGTDKRKWHDWWKGEKLRHPELFDDPEERPGEAGKKGPVTGK